MKYVIIILVILIILILWFISTHNALVRLASMVEEAFSTMDVYLKKRYDLIPNTVETVKGYAKHEQETLDKVVRARYAAMNATTQSEKLAAEGELSNSLNRLLSITEAYPDLKANSNFQDLQRQLAKMEEEIASCRKYYNAVVRRYNVKVQAIPSNVVANIFHFETKPSFQVSSLEERENVKVQF